MTAVGAPAAVRVSPGAVPARWEVRVPGSKSLTNRALLLAGVADGRSRLIGPLVADDTEAMAGVLRALGARVRTVNGSDGSDGSDGWARSGESDRSDGSDGSDGSARSGGSDLLIDGLGGPPVGPADVYCAMAGTVARFVVPMLAAGRGRFTVDAHPQLRRRPLGPLLDALRAQGAGIEERALPLTVTADGLAGGEVSVDASISSQFLSGLLMAAPLARSRSWLRFGALVSAPYVELTIDVMRAFGAEVQRGDGVLRVEPRRYRATELEIEPDVSTASYFLASAALTGTTVTLPGLNLDATRQGDIALVAHLERMGCVVGGRAPLTLTGPPRLRGVHVDMGSSSDAFMTLACVAPFADGPTTIEGVGHARVKESDRVRATAENLRRLGIAVDEGPDYLRVHPGDPRRARLPTFEDHRIAMAFALIGTRVPVELEAPGVVAKTCPTFFALWRRTGAIVEDRA